ncbi:MAG: hypothetical protein IJM47_07400 [Synergistaceae bacterium]|nr:hypothetical protein [Synergistaceae bacterium]
MPEELFSVTDVQDLIEATDKKDTPSPAEPVRLPKEPEFLALKSIFTPSRGDMGGGYCVIFEGKTGRTVFQIFWLAKPYSSGQVPPEVTKDWRTFVKRLPSLGPLDKDWSERLQIELKEILTIEEKKKLYENYTKAKVRQIESMYRRSFEAAAQCVFTASTEAEPISRSELERAKVIKPLPPSPEQLAKMKKEQEEREKAIQADKEREEAKKESNFEGTVIMCTPQVDPVRGKASSDITPGDVIGVKIEGEGTSALVSKYLEENEIEPLFPVYEIRDTQGKKFIYVKISDEIRGCVTITKDIKIRVKDQPQSEQKQKAASIAGDLFFFGLLGVALIVLLFVIRYFFL